VAGVKAAALRMSSRQPAEAATEVASSSGKGIVPANSAAQSGTAGGIVTAGAIAAQQAHQSGARPIVIATIIVLAIALAVTGWFGWRWWQRRLQES
jgi:hypothetical protein